MAKIKGLRPVCPSCLFVQAHGATKCNSCGATIVDMPDQANELIGAPCVNAMVGGSVFPPKSRDGGLG
ncbi:hypothetical protein KKI23_03915 [Patescibacteria group bacterium]|nr:hypothetical protein [Patescibacteria group bacterium]